MIIFATFVTRKDAPEEFELIDAWDEYSVDAYPEGFTRSRREHLDALGSDLNQWRTLEIRVDESAVRKAFFPDPVNSTVDSVASAAGPLKGPETSV